MTSLAKQLQRLAVPHTQVTYGEDRKKASLLFDQQEAANIDRDTFHAIGVIGLEELGNIDEEFFEFEKSLFGDSSLTFERSVQSKAVNDKLDETISNFLVNLSPYCLLKPAHKALEWLIHRFHIQLYNLDDLLLCFLPHHESKIFVRVLQMIKFNNKTASKWDWLMPCQKAGVHLSRSTLINHCSTDPAFLNFICNAVPIATKAIGDDQRAAQKCRVLFSFYTTVVVSVLETREVSENVVSTLLPRVSLGLHSKILDFKASSYMILAQLLHRTKLKTSILKVIQQILAKTLSSELMREGISCLLLLFQTQDMSNIKLSKRSFRYLCSQVGIISTLAELSSQFESTVFLSCLITKLIPASFKQAVGIATSGDNSESDSGSIRILSSYMSLLHQLLSVIELPDDIAEKATLQFLQRFVDHGKLCLEEDDDERLKDSLQSIVRLLEGKYSSKMDIAVQTVLKESKSSEGKKLVQEFLNLYVLSVPNQLVEDYDTNIVLSLNHRLEVVREQAVDTLLRNKDKVDDKEFLRDSLAMRLKDECPNVVSKVLDFGEELWSIMENEGETISLLLQPIWQALDKQTAEWEKTGVRALGILCGYTGALEMEVVTGLLPYFFMMSQTFYLSALKTILKSPLASNCALLKKTSEEWDKVVKHKTTTIGDLTISMATCLAKGLLVYPHEEYMYLVSTWLQSSIVKRHRLVPCLLLVMLDSMVTMVTDPCVELRLGQCQIQLVESCLKGENLKTMASPDNYMSTSWSDLVSELTSKLTAGQLPDVFCGKALTNVIQRLKGRDILHKECSLIQYGGNDSASDLHIKVSIRLFDLLLTRSLKGKKVSPATYQNLLGQFMKTCFSDTTSLMKFFGLLWTQHTHDEASELGLTSSLQVHALKIGLVHLQKMGDQSLTDILQRASPVFASLLVSLTSPFPEVRRLVIKCVKEIHSRADDTQFSPLLKKIVRWEEEIEADVNYVQQAVYSTFAKCGVATTKHKSRGRQSRGPVADPKEQCLTALIGVIIDQSTPRYIQQALLNVFSLLNTETFLQSVLPLMAEFLTRESDEMTLTEAECLNTLTRQFTMATAGVLKTDCPGLTLFIKALKFSKSLSPDVPSTQSVALEQVNNEMYDALDAEVQQQILTTLFDVWVNAEDISVVNTVRRIIRHLSLNAVHIETEMKACLKTQMPRSVRELKRMKRDATSEGESGELGFDSPIWQRLTVILEAVQTKKKLTNYTVLVLVSFQLLARILESENHATAEYLKQLVLSLLYNLCTKMEANKDNPEVEIVPEDNFNMELVVNCIRSSENPQTHHQALLLLTSAATIFPEHLLHNMMSVFTFMGANIMRQDDAYSFHIISRILETVIPALITACKQRKRVPKEITNNQEDIITTVIQVFVDAYPHIPEHRRNLLFTKLIKVIGEEAYLWRTLLLIMGMVVTKGTLRAQLATDSQETKDTVLPRDVEFCVGLCAEFPPSVQLTAAREMLQYIAKLPDDIDDVDKGTMRSLPQSLGKLRKEDVAIFCVQRQTAKQLRHFKYGTMHLLVSLFSGTDFIAQFAVNTNKETLQMFQSLLEVVLEYITHVARTTNMYSDKPTSKFWRALQHKTYDLMDKLVSLLPDTMFIEVVTGLVSHQLPSIQRKAMELLNVKLQQQQKESHTEEETLQLLSMVPHLSTLVVNLSTKPEGEVTEEESVNCQTAFISLKLLCRTVGASNTGVFVQVLKTSLKVFSHCETNHQVAACALLCIAEICANIKVHAIQYLPSFMPRILSILQKEDHLVEDELFLLSIVSTLCKVVENLTHFLSPYLLDILYHVSCLCGLSESVESLQKQQLQLRLKAIRTTLSQSVETRVLLPSITSCFSKLQEDKKLFCIPSLMTILHEHFLNIKKEVLLSHVTALQNFFLTCLDMRLVNPELLPKEINKLEDATMETLISMVMKLSESTFKPFLFKLYDWATSSDDHRERVIVFYRLADRLAEKLKSLFCLFAGHFVNHAARMLDLNNKTKKVKRFFETDKAKRKMSNQLLIHLIDCLHKCFQYDSEGFVTKERFETLMQPLVDQLENEQGSEVTYQERVEGHLIPCIVQMALAVRDDSLWRVLSYQICLKTRHSDAKVRCAGLKALDALHKKLGEDYLNLLPETIPFLAELMEDESDEVEKLCQTVIAEMEKTLGEPLQKYF